MKYDAVYSGRNLQTFEGTWFSYLQPSTMNTEAVGSFETTRPHMSHPIIVWFKKKLKYLNYIYKKNQHDAAWQYVYL